MRGTASQLIDEIVDVRTKGNPSLQGLVRAHLIMQGINPNDWAEDTPDDPAIIAKLQKILAEFLEN